MARLSVLLPILLSIAAFILSLLVLLAGKSESFLPNVYLLRLDTSQIQPANLDLDAITDDILPDGIDLPVSLEDIPDNIVNSLAQTTAKRLGLADFYTSHIMNYCSGVYTDAGDSDPNTNETHTTYCSPVDGLHAFNPIEIFERELVPGVTIQDLGIPQQVIDGVETLAAAYKAMFITLVVGVALSGLSLIFAILIGWKESRLIAFIATIVALLATLSLAAAAAIATAISVKLKDVVNDEAGSRINIWAENDGGKLMGMAWAAVASMLVVTVYWLVGCCCGPRSKRHDRRMREKEMVMNRA